MDGSKSVARRAEVPSRDYRPPSVVLYGSVAARTLANTTGSIADNMAMLQMAM